MGHLLTVRLMIAAGVMPYASTAFGISYRIPEPPAYIEEKARIDKANIATEVKDAKSAVESARSADDAKRVAENKITALSDRAEDLVEERKNIEKEKAKLEVNQRIYSTGVIGLLLSNVFTAISLIRSRRRERLEHAMLELQIQKAQMELDLLKESRRTPKEVAHGDPDHPSY